MKSSDIHSFVKMAAKLTGTLLTKVDHYTLKQLGDYGEAIYDAPVSRKALILRKEERKILPNGSEGSSHTQLVIPEKVVVNLTDRFKWANDGLAANEYWPIVSVEMPLDDSGKPYIVQVFLGYRVN